MKIPYNFEKCIVCLDQPCGDWEHVLPEFIGGRLQGRMLCNRCNNTFGSSLVSKLKSDASIRLAVEALKGQLPALYAKMQDKAIFGGRTSDGSVIRTSITNNKIKILPGRGENDLLILDTGEAANALYTKLIRLHFSPEEAKIWRHRFVQLEENSPLHIPTGETFVKHPIPPLYPELSKYRVDDRLLVLIAFEFLSLLIGKLIFRSSFHPIRQYILSGVDTDLVTVEQFAAGSKYDTFHVISVVPMEGAIRVDIRFFRWIAFVVTFHGFDYYGPDSVYFEDLQIPQSFIAPTRKDVYRGNWFTEENA